MDLKKILLWMLIIFYIFLLFLFIDRPGFFSKISMEDGLVENLSAILCFISCGLFLYIFIILSSFEYKRHFLERFISLLFAGLFFIIGMEEVSWFQRVVYYDTPEIFKANEQGEFNLHNLYTQPVENAYYFSAFILLIFIPFIYDNFEHKIPFKNLHIFIPGRYLILGSVIFVAYNYDQWNVFVIQLCFYISFFILFYYLISYIRRKKNFLPVATLILIFVLSQTLFLMYGEINFHREWDIKEYKEFLIPLSFTIYSVDVLVKANFLKNINLPYFEKEVLFKNV